MCKAPKIPPPAPPPELPQAPTRVSPAVLKARASQRQQEQLASGQSSTILTSPRGVTRPGVTRQRTLVGGPGEAQAVQAGVTGRDIATDRITPVSGTKASPGSTLLTGGRTQGGGLISGVARTAAGLSRVKRSGGGLISRTARTAAQLAQMRRTNTLLGASDEEDIATGRRRRSGGLFAGFGGGGASSPTILTRPPSTFVGGGGRLR